MVSHFKRHLRINSYDHIFFLDVNLLVMKINHKTMLILKKHLVCVKAIICNGKNMVVCI